MKKYLFVLPLILLSSCGRDNDCNCKKTIYTRQHIVVEGYKSSPTRWVVHKTIKLDCNAIPTNEINITETIIEKEQYFDNIKAHSTSYRQYGEQITCK